MRTADRLHSAFLWQPEQPESTLQYSAHNEIIKQPSFLQFKMSSYHCIIKSNNVKPHSTILTYHVEYVMVPTQLHP